VLLYEWMNRAMRSTMLVEANHAAIVARRFMADGR
jgi:hypothetical protein